MTNVGIVLYFDVTYDRLFSFCFALCPDYTAPILACWVNCRDSDENGRCLITAESWHFRRGNFDNLNKLRIAVFPSE
jgi:hypothetical protein